MKYIEQRRIVAEDINIETIFKEFYSLLDLVEMFKDNSSKAVESNVILHIHRYIIIRLVTILEVFFRFIVKIIINGSEELHKRIQEDDITMKFSDLEDFKNGKMTISNIFAASKPLQTFTNFKNVVNKLLQINYQNIIIKFRHDKNKLNTNKSQISYFEKIDITKLNNIRNDIVHTLKKNNYQELNIFESYWAVEELMIITLTMIKDNEKINQKKIELKRNGITQAYVSRAKYYTEVKNINEYHKNESNLGMIDK